MSVRPRSLVLVALVLWLAGSTGVAEAGTSKAGIFFYASKTKSFPKTAFDGEVTAQCPKDAEMTSPGGSVPKSIPGGRLSELRYSDGNDPDADADDAGVTVGHWNDAAREVNVKSFAVCTRELVGDVEFVTTLSSVPASGFATATAACPANHTIVGGGGGSQSADVHLNSSYTSSVTQWQVDVSNTSGAPQPFASVAACVADGVVPVFYAQQVVQVPGFGELTTKVPCPPGTRVSGGGWGAASTSVEAESSRPYDGRDRDSAPDDGWSVRSLNGSIVQAQSTIFVACVGPPI